MPVRLFFFFFLVRLFDPLEGLGWALGLEKCEGFYENICEGFFKNVLSRETRPLVWAAHGFGFWGFQGTVADEACTSCEPVCKFL